jgi:hypothetical protein
VRWAIFRRSLHDPQALGCVKELHEGAQLVSVLGRKE